MDETNMNPADDAVQADGVVMPESEEAAADDAEATETPAAE